ncbi:MAG: IS5 family transposase [Chloroflexota bacterium]
MQTQTYPTDLTDRQWDCIKEYMPVAKPGGRPRRVAMRAVRNAIRYVLVTGCPWRQVPHDYPNWQTVYGYFRGWRDDGTWQRIHDTLRAQVRTQAGRQKHPTAGCLDSQSGKASAHRGERGSESGTHVNGRKRQLLVDTLGLLLAMVVTTASMSDPQGAKRICRRLQGGGKKLRWIWVDGAYRGTLLEWVVMRDPFRLPPIVHAARPQGFVVLPRRWVVERTFAWRTQCRRRDKDYEVLRSTSEALISIAMIRLMIRRVA